MSNSSNLPTGGHPGDTGFDEFVTCAVDDLPGAAAHIRALEAAGTEVFMNDIRPRTEALFRTEGEFCKLVNRFSEGAVKRVHCSYWGSPTAFVANIGFDELVDRFSDTAALRRYFGDMSGRHMFTRWCDEYALASAIEARAYVFHLIDYLHVDGAWEFSVSRETVLEAMVIMLQQFLRELDDRGLLHEGSPVIELENAGWGLEFGVQTADDFVAVLDQVFDEYDRLRIGWDLNHLLHAIGERDGEAAFLLPDGEISSSMRELQREAGGDGSELAKTWIKQNVFDPRLSSKVGALHLSDCPLKPEEFFRNGKLQGGYWTDGTYEEQAAAGLALVLEHYDNHVPIGHGILDPHWVRSFVVACAKQIQPRRLMVLHELKNEPDMWAAAARQQIELQ
jgi:hypothetical protein